MNHRRTTLYALIACALLSQSACGGEDDELPTFSPERFTVSPLPPVMGQEVGWQVHGFGYTRVEVYQGDVLVDEVVNTSDNHSSTFVATSNEIPTARVWGHRASDFTELEASQN